MAHLLGSQYCIESLTTDVSDLQAAITDVFSRSGPVKHPSWKYPDKDSNEVDVPQLLEVYSFSNDEECNRVAHIVLLELVIDRMVLLMQAMSKYVEQTLVVGSRKATAVQSGNNKSIGLVVKRYWSRMVHTYTVLQQLQSEVKTRTRKMEDQEIKIAQLEEELQQYKTGVGTVSFTQDVFSAQSSAISRTEIARDESSRPSQTVETAFVPCEACYRVQHCLKEVGTGMNRICESQELPCSLAKFQSQVEDMEWLSANDVGHWCAEQNKDLARINKHFEFLVSTIEPLKQDLANQKKKVEDLESKLSHSNKEVKSERNTQAIMQKQFQNKLKEAERLRVEVVNRETKEKDEMERRTKDLQREISELSKEKDKQATALQRLGTIKEHLEQELHQQQENNEQVTDLQKQVQVLQENQINIKKKLKESERELAKEKARAKSLSMHSEAVQGKQGSMVQRIDDLDKENEKLREEMAELEDLKEQLEERMERTEDKKRVLEKEYKEQKTVNSSLQKDKETFEQQILDLNDIIKDFQKQVDEAKEHEKLLTMYPDLNGPVNPNLSGTGDIALDMENQVKANTMRIMTLEEQNASLRNSISKVMETQKRGPKQMFSNPVPLWRPRSPDDELTEACPTETPTSSVLPPREAPPQDPVQEERRRPAGKSSSIKPASSKHKQDVRQSFTVGRSPVVDSVKRKSRPPSGSENSSFSTYMKLKNAGMMKAGRDPPATKFKDSDYVQEDVFSCKGQSTSAKASRQKERSGVDTFTCTKCDKMYNSKRDLEIHNTYCYGGL